MTGRPGRLVMPLTLAAAAALIVTALTEVLTGAVTGGLAPNPPPCSTGARAAGVPAAVPAWLRPAVATAARTDAVPAAMLAALARVESDFQPDAVGPPVTGGPALGLMQFLPRTWALVNRSPGATPFDPAAALLAAGIYLRRTGTLPGGGWSAPLALYGYNHSWAYVTTVLAVTARYSCASGPALRVRRGAHRG